ncbi:MAG: hypothetical protein Q9226_001894 [Calogaya cf. arnoldii]
MDQTQPIEQHFEWPSSAKPDPSNFSLASKMCTTLVLGDPSIKNTVTHLPSGWSSNDVILVSTSQTDLIVKIPRKPTGPNAASACKSEAFRTCWAAKYGFGPKVLCIDPESGAFAMERLRGQSLTLEMIKTRLPQVMRLLREIHMTKPAKWMGRFDPVDVVMRMLDSVKLAKARELDEIKSMENIISDTAEIVKDHPWVLCHNDFHSHNLFLQAAKSNYCTGKLIAIDFEDCSLGDPMWDLAYLIVNLEMERKPEELEDLYGVNVLERGRVRAYIPLAMVHVAAWAAVRGGAWEQHCKEIMVRLKKVVGGSHTKDREAGKDSLPESWYSFYIQSSLR